MAANRYIEIPPSPSLRPWVACYWAKRSEGQGGVVAAQRVLPDGCADILCDLGDADGLDGGGPGGRVRAIGTMTRPILVSRRGRLDYLGVRFRPGRARPFLGTPLHELTDTNAPLADLWGSRVAELEERLQEASTLRDRIGLLEASLTTLVAGADTRGRASLAVEAIARSRGRLPVEEIARQAGLSRQYLARRFRTEVGIPPKTFARVVRFNSALERARAGDSSWIAIANDSGYYDQSHLIDEFRELAGLPPTSLLAGA